MSSWSLSRLHGLLLALFVFRAAVPDWHAADVAGFHADRPFHCRHSGHPSCGRPCRRCGSAAGGAGALWWRWLGKAIRLHAGVQGISRMVRCRQSMATMAAVSPHPPNCCPPDAAVCSGDRQPASCVPRLIQRCSGIRQPAAAAEGHGCSCCGRRLRALRLHACTAKRMQQKEECKCNRKEMNRNARECPTGYAHAFNLPPCSSSTADCLCMPLL